MHVFQRKCIWNNDDTQYEPIKYDDGGTGNQSMTGLGALMMRNGMIPSVCFSMSDAMLFKSMMMHGGSMNGMMDGNMSGRPSMMSGDR